MNYAELNKAIAEYMGGKQRTDGVFMFEFENTPVADHKLFKDLKYHKSWEWLMPVIEKISKHKYEDGDTAYPRTFGMPFEENPTKVMVRFNRCHLHYGDTLLEATYNAVIDFIKAVKKSRVKTSK